MSVEGIIANPHAHPCLFRAIITEGHPPQYALLAKRPIMVIHEEQAGSRVASNVNVWPSVFVQIRRYHSHAVTLCDLSDASLLTDVGKCSVAIVLIQRMPSCWQPARSAFDGNAFPIAIGVLSGNRRMFERETHIVGDEQVKVPVKVVIQETASRSPSRLTVQKPSSLRHIRESSIPIIAVENILSEVAAKNIFKSVVVVVPDADSRSPTYRVQAGLFRNVSECPVTMVLV